MQRVPTLSAKKSWATTPSSVRNGFDAFSWRSRPCGRRATAESPAHSSAGRRLRFLPPPR
eukprot:12601460-Alexandrium_andersonii.AAC.1